MIDQLIDILGREAALFETFLSLLERQREALLGNDTDTLTGITDSMREKLVESQLLGKERLSLVEEIRKMNAIEGDLNVTQLIDLVDQRHADQLTQLRDLIFSLDERIVQIRNANAMLLNKSREFIVKMMQMLSKINSPEGAYTNAGAPARQDAHVMVDRRV